VRGGERVSERERERERERGREREREIERGREREGVPPLVGLELRVPRACRKESKIVQ